LCGTQTSEFLLVRCQNVLQKITCFGTAIKGPLETLNVRGNWPESRATLGRYELTSRFDGIVAMLSVKMAVQHDMTGCGNPILHSQGFLWKSISFQRSSSLFSYMGYTLREEVDESAYDVLHGKGVKYYEILQSDTLSSSIQYCLLQCCRTRPHCHERHLFRVVYHVPVALGPHLGPSLQLHLDEFASYCLCRGLEQTFTWLSRFITKCKTVTKSVFLISLTGCEGTIHTTSRYC
jgi:hypothetical protein